MGDERELRGKRRLQLLGEEEGKRYDTVRKSKRHELLTNGKVALLIYDYRSDHVAVACAKGRLIHLLKARVLFSHYWFGCPQGCQYQSSISSILNP